MGDQSDSISIRAWTYTSTTGGMVRNLKLTDDNIPAFKPGHILIEVLSVSLNPGDYKFPDLPFIKWLLTHPVSTGFDFCGRIRALPRDLGHDQRNLQVGQSVFGMHRDFKTLGTLKTIMWVHPDSCYPLPDKIPAGHGAALGIGALTAYQAISPYAGSGRKILINGGTGGVGTFCIQVAKAFDMHVIATCSEAGAQLCKDLGADEVLDYKSDFFHQSLTKIKVDLVVDTVGHDPQLHRRSGALLQPNGQFVLVALMDDDWTGKLSMLSSWLCPTWLGGVPRKWKAIFTQSKLSDLEPVAWLAEAGKLKVVVDSVFSFNDVPKAFDRLQSGRAKGKVLVDVSADST